MKSKLPELRTLSQQDTNACVVWPYSRFLHFGYGQIHYKGKKAKTHRVAWMLEHGDISSDTCVLHKCDNPPCINLRHLFLGTRAINNKDRNAKGRQFQQKQMVCKRGHVFDRIYYSWRVCSRCKHLTYLQRRYA